MKYLTEQYWNYFLKESINKYGNQVIINDGEKFEELVGQLLELIYKGKNVVWKKTKTTHDGNRDFVGKKKDGSFIWAECKNYKNKISMKIIAPTLVMAEIENIREILVFSYSPINKSARKKLICYADKKRKDIYFYDDTNLEQLLFQYRTKIFKDYFPDFPDNIAVTNNFEPYIFNCSMPGFHYDKGEDIGSNEFHVKIDELFFVGIGIVNNNFNETLKIQMSFYNYNDLEYLELLDIDMKQSKKFNWRMEFELTPGKAEFFKINYRLGAFKEKITLPTIKISFLNNEIKDKIISFEKIFCNNIFSVPFMGSQYREALKNIESYTINKSSLSLSIIYGKSGVGKSRMLNEALSCFVKNHYQVLNFSADSLSKNSFLMFKEIIYFIYNITPELVSNLFDEFELTQNIYNDSEQYKIFSLLTCLQEENYKEINSFILNYKHLIFEKILSQKIAILIDNLQFAETFFVDFIYDLCIYGKTYQRNSNCVILISYNEDYYCNNSLNNLRILAEETKNSFELNTYVYYVEGLTKNKQSLGFLKELIHSSLEDNSYFNMIVEKANHVPKYIENIVNYLINKNVLIVENNYSTIKDYKKFYEVIDNLPNSFESIFKLRFDLFLCSEKINCNEALLILSAIHFSGNLSINEFKQLRLNRETVEKLEAYGFISRSNYGCTEVYCFNHDLYEKYFMKNIDMESVFLEYIADNKLSSACNLVPWQNFLLKVSTQMDNKIISNHEINNLPSLAKQVPYKIKNYFYNKIITYLSGCNLYKVNFDNYINCINRIIQDCKNNLGSNIAKELYKKIYSILSVISIEERENSSFYRDFLDEYSEILLQTHDETVIDIYNERINYFSGNVEQNYLILARLYNRIYVYYKHLKKENVVHNHLERSIDICEKYCLIGQKVENLFDKGNYYLYVEGKRDFLIECWEKGCELFTNNKDKLGYLTLNVYKKNIQVEILKGNYEIAMELIERAFDYIETGKFNQQTLFFNNHIYYLKTLCGFLSGQLDISEIQEALDNCARYNNLLDNKKSYNIYFLYAKLYYAKENFSEMLINYSMALSNIDNTLYHREYYNHIKKVITEDCYYKISTIRLKELEHKINYDIVTDKKFKNIFMKQVNLDMESIILFEKNFKSVANIISQNKKDGFLF